MFDDVTLKKILTDAKLLPVTEIRKAAREAKVKKTPLETHILKQRLLPEDLLYKEAARVLQVPFTELTDRIIRNDVLFIVPETIAATHRIIPFDQSGKEVSLATTELDDLQTFEFIRRKTGLEPKIFLTTPAAIEEVLKQYHRNLKAEFEEIAQPKEEMPPEEEQKRLKKLAQDLPVIRIVDSLLDHAIYEGASDIHIEPTEQDLTIRFRIDGVLRKLMTLPKIVEPGVIARIKVLSNLKLDEHRLPQDGRFKIATTEYRYSIRVSVFPVFDGEKAVLRLLSETSAALTLEQLGVQPQPLEIVRRNIKRPHGISLVTGPTGSGKTTTLYSIMNILNAPGVNIATVEDPIEYRIPGVNQSQVNPRIGFSFATGLRSLLRQDPNIIMVGEIRDAETADIAINAAMTGHLVLSTLHTNDAATALPRLLDMGVPAFLVAFTANMIIAQRLVRKICRNCVTSYRLTAADQNELKTLFTMDSIVATLRREGVIGKTQTLPDLTFWKGVGCRQCGQEGYKGRIGIYEVLEVTPEMSTLINERATVDAIKKKTVENGMITLVEDGFMKAKQGITTIAEVIRVTRE